MNKLLTFGLWILLSAATVNGIKCIWCSFERSAIGCLLKRDPCKLHVGESCYKKIVFFGRTPIYTEKGCVLGCEDQVADKKPDSLSQSITCCANSYFCNH